MIAGWRRRSGEWTISAAVRLAVATLVLVATAALVACGEAKKQAAAPRVKPLHATRPTEAAPTRRKEVRDCTGDRRALGGPSVSYAAVARHRTVAYRRPGARSFAAFGVTNINGAATVFGVTHEILDRRCATAWYRVKLPTWPNGSEGYVRSGDVSIVRLNTRIVVDLSARRLTFFRDGRPVMRTPVAVGAPTTPTPTGRFYVDQRLIPGDPNGPWGPGALGISAHSEVLRDWAQGGPIAIHGTNAPWSIGKAASHGCVRVDNAVLRKLFAAAGAGTPVIIQA
jgi:hypothetical protein